MTQPKETIEEASIRFNPTKTRSSAFGSKYVWIPHKERQQFINGAKWQEEHFNSLIEEKDKEILRLKEELLNLDKAISEDGHIDPIYVKEYKIKVKGFKIDKTLPKIF